MGRIGRADYESRNLQDSTCHTNHTAHDTARKASARRHGAGAMAKKGRRSARVHARAARAAQAEEADRCHPCAGQPQPEAEAVECSTCCYPFSKQDLFGCDTAQCDYIQCKDCIIKGRSGLCKHAGCVIMHWTCPACTNHVGDESKLMLTDDRFTKDDVLAVLDKVRQRDAAVMGETLDRMRNAMEPFVQEMTAAAQEAASWYDGADY
jgi:hypothetical protein